MEREEKNSKFIFPLLLHRLLTTIIILGLRASGLIPVFPLQLISK